MCQISANQPKAPKRTKMSRSSKFNRRLVLLTSGTVLALTCLMLSGCGSPTKTDTEILADGIKAAQAPTGPTFPGVTLKVAALQDPALGQITADLVGEWRASRQAELEVVEKPVLDPTGMPNDKSVDIWLVRGQSLGELIDKNTIEPLGDLNADWPARPPVFESMVCRYGPDRYAVPVGTSVLVMAFQESLTTDADFKAATEKAGIAFPPTTWDELEKAIPLLQPKFEMPVALPTQGSETDSLPLDIFLARATSAGKHRDHFSFLMSAENMAPRVAGTPFVDALKGLIAIRPKQKLTAGEARAAFRDGKAAILLDYAENATTWAKADTKGKISVAPLPGSLKVYEPDRKEYEKMPSVNLSAYLPNGGGWLAVIAKGRPEKNLAAARDFLTYLGSDSTAAVWATDKRMTLLPTRDALLANGFVDARTAPRVESGDWGESILKQLTSSNPVVGLRIPQARTFLNQLEIARQAAFDGQIAEVALSKAAEGWTSLVKQYGPARLKWHYRRSLVKPVTDPTPPPAGQ